MDKNIYSIRQNILKAMKKAKVAEYPCRVEDISDFDGFLFENPTFEEIRTQWHELRSMGFLKAHEGFEGEYCTITDKGLEQINPEFKKEVFVWGPRALKTIVLFLFIGFLAIGGTGCGTTITSKKFDAHGAVTDENKTYLSMPKIIMDEMAQKNIAYGANGWGTILEATFMDPESLVPTFKIMIWNANKYHISLKDPGSSNQITPILEQIMNNNLDINATAKNLNINSGPQK